MAITSRVPARFTLAHGLMVLAGLLTFVLVNGALQDKSETVAVVYAGERSEVGSISPVIRTISSKTPGLENFATESDIDGKVLVRTLEAGSPIMKSDLIDEDRRSFRIFAVPVDAYHVNALHLKRYDRVDIIGFDQDRRAVYVAIGLAIEGTSTAATDGFATSGDSFITVQVSDVDALRLAEAQREGPLHVVRNTGSAVISNIGDPGTAVPGDSTTSESAGAERP
ncbi:MAG: hypothetical protein HKN03_16495 [Acidimicrobiales bacterium]|nr:hypothetical protein [Acidimicrobiales bacterium]